ncbi:MAG: ABC transporter permease subunit [Leptolinea sp.]|nr:ABC transporter permease subunit [Leptolinea sp.]
MTGSKIFITSLKNEGIALLVLLGAWGLISTFYPVFIIPSPMDVVSDFPGYLPASFPTHLITTSERIGIGFGISFVLGCIIGTLAFANGWEAPVNALMSAANILPGMILGVIFLLVFGIGSQTPIALVIFLTLPTISINTISGLARRDPTLEQYLITLRANRGDILQYVYLPALVPTLLSNLSIGLGLSIKVVLMGEFIGSQDGLGYLLNVARIYFNMREVFFYLFLLLVFTLLYQGCLTLLANSLLKKFFFTA